jgi:hypothetical protein
MAFVEGIFVRAMSGGDKIGKTKIGKGVSTWQNSKPLAVSVTSAQLHEITLLQEITLEDVPSTMTPQKIIGDKAYDSNPYEIIS